MVGYLVGDSEGGEVGHEVGLLVCPGPQMGLAVGLEVGDFTVGVRVGLRVGVAVGIDVGAGDGLPVGFLEGFEVGFEVGFLVGNGWGFLDGLGCGACLFDGVKVFIVEGGYPPGDLLQWWVGDAVGALSSHAIDIVAVDDVDRKITATDTQARKRRMVILLRNVSGLKCEARFIDMNLIDCGAAHQKALDRCHSLARLKPEVLCFTG